MKHVFIDGSAGTTGLQLRSRLEQREDITLLNLPEEQRKDPEARREYLNRADIAFLCLPDAAAVEAAALTDNPETCIIDTSTAHRVSPDWVYGFPEITGQAAVKGAKRIANPGCHATGFISLVYPLVHAGVLSKDCLLSCFSLTGYSGGGKQMIGDYEAPNRPETLASGGIYGLNQKHKHLPEMQKICGLDSAPIFCPIVEPYLKGMATTVPLFGAQLAGNMDMEQLRQVYGDFYAGQPLIHVLTEAEAGELGKIYGNRKAGTDSLDIIVSGNPERFTVTALFDNLGKGASGAAVENMNLIMGLSPETGLVI